MSTPVAPPPADADLSKTAEPNTPGASVGRKRKAKGPATPIPAPRENSEKDTSAHTNKRKKPRSRMQHDTSMSALGFGSADLSSPMWQTIVAFRAPHGKAFDRVLDAGFTLASVKRMVSDKYRIASGVPIHLSYEAADGTHIDLDDSEDFRAFQVHAARESIITVFIDVPESQMFTAPEAPAASPAKARGRRGRGAARTDEGDETTNEAEATEVSQLVDVPQPEAEAQSTPAKRGRKRKVDQPPAPASASAPEAQPEAPAPTPTPAPAPVPAPAPEAEDDEEEDVPLSSQATAPPSSQPEGGEKQKRSRRTKAEMEAFRAEKAAQKAAKEQERADRTNGEADTTQADETVIVHEPRNDEHSAAASAAVQALVEHGIDAMHLRLSELKAKKQRKNAVEREEQKMLVNMVKGTSVTPSEADVSSRELARNAQRADADAAERDLETAPEADDSASSTESRDYFSQPESHANLSNSQIHGPSPRPDTNPMESTPQRASRAQAESSRRTMSGAFTKLSELRPSALRRSFSRQESPMFSASASEASADVGRETPATVPEASEESDSSDDSDSDSSDDDAPAPSQQSALPPSKLAGASTEASVADASKAKKKRSFFSALS